MSTETQAQSSNQSAPVSAEDQGQNLEINRSPEEYAKRLKETAEENKRYRTQNADMRAKLEAIEQEKLQAQGKFEELAKAANDKAAALEKELKATRANYAFQSVTNQVEAAAARLGCVDTKALLKLMDLDNLEVDEAYHVDPKSLKDALDQQLKSRAYLFSKEAPKVHDLPPAGKPQEKSVKGLSTNEKLAKLAEVMGKK